jgi:hypothetical protein
MKSSLFTTLVTVAVAEMIGQAAFAETKSKAPTDKPQAKAGRCVHSCTGYAQCKGNGNASCKGKNDCANSGQVPKACSDKKDAAACAKVTDAKQQPMCTWYDS